MIVIHPEPATTYLIHLNLELQFSGQRGLRFGTAACTVRTLFLPKKFVQHDFDSLAASTIDGTGSLLRLTKLRNVGLQNACSLSPDFLAAWWITDLIIDLLASLLLMHRSRLK